MAAKAGGLPDVHLGLPIDQAKSAYSGAYLDACCAQAGVGMGPTSIDKDTLAIDATIAYEEIDVRVQLKCTESPNKSGAGYRLDLKDGWITKWRKFQVPPFVVLVVVPRVKDDWISHPDGFTKHSTTAYWQRFDPASTAKSLHMPRTNRLTSKTIEEWRKDVLISEFGADPNAI